MTRLALRVVRVVATIPYLQVLVLDVIVEAWRAEP